MKHVSTQVATKAPAKKQSTYGAFILDPTLTFDNFDVERSIHKSPSTANFSRPLSIRPTFVSDDPDPKAVFGLPKLSRQSSLASSWRDSGFSTAPSTPSAMESSKFADRMSFMMPVQTDVPELDLTFPAEELSANPNECTSPPSLRWNDSRPGKASSQIQATKDTAQDVVNAASAKPLIAPILRTDGDRFEDIRSAPTVTRSFPDFKQALSGQQELPKGATVRSEPPSPALPFLQLDPFRCPLHGDKRERPKSVGVGSSPMSQADTTGEIDFAAPVKKQGTPSVMSTKSSRSVRSIRKRLSKFKKIMKGPLNDGDND